MRKNPHSVSHRSYARQSVVMVVALLLASATLARAEQIGMLRLGDRQYAAGTISDSPDGRSLHWNHPAFTEPFQFPMPSVVSVSFPTADQPAAAQGQFGLQLVGGGLLYGDLKSIDDDTIRLVTETFGELSLRRQSVQRLFRWRGGADRLYVGPQNLAQWQAHPDEAWSDAGSVLATSQAGASVVGDVRLPPQAAIDVKVGWDDSPNFRLCFGADPAQENALEAFSGFQIEVWGDELVLLREQEDTAAVARIGTIDSVPGYVQLTVLLDQAQHRAMVLGADGRVVADLSMDGDADSGAQARSGFGFQNIRGASRLESLSVRAGSAEMFDAADQSQPLVWLDNDESFPGRLQASEDDGRTLVFVEGEQTRRVPTEQIARIVLQPLQAVATEEADDAAADEQADAEARLSVVTRRGMRLVGRLEKVEQQKMWLSVEELDEPISIAIADIRDFVVLDNQTVEARQLDSRVGRLETTDTILQGAFEDGQVDGPASCFVFAPILAANTSSLRRDAVAEMIYRDAVVVNVQAPTPQAQVVGGAGMVMRLNAEIMVGEAIQIGKRRAVPAKSTPKTDPSKRTLHLRAGDTVECEVLSIDEVGIKVRCKGDIEALVPHAQIRAVELESLSGNPVADQRRERLLTVPRMRRDNPPTHLIVSVDGDYLRGRLQSMDEDALSIETRLATQQIPRKYVAQIIWLHEDEIRKADGTPATDEEPETQDQTPQPNDTLPPTDAIDEGLVQVVRGDGTRLSFVAEQVAEGIITGTNEFLGVCSQDIQNVDRLVFGGRIFTQTDNLPFASWRLTHAPDPMVFRDDGSGSPGGTSGKSSELVGQPAPDFELRLLSGENYRLSDHQGDVIVLDFWASWCGPCMQAMPNVDKMIHEFDESGVQLIAVNLQESEQRIQQALERLNIATVVAMDETGEIAERYQASSIPQTVVIDRQGKITHLFVGGGSRTLEQLRTAVAEAAK